jgi:hypothetical protein
MDMIRAGDTIENPVTGERIVFHQTSRETNGEAVVFETFVEPHGADSRLSERLRAANRCSE